LNVNDKVDSHQCKLVMLAVIINSFHTIWFCRNQMRFNDKGIDIRSAFNLIIYRLTIFLIGLLSSWLSYPLKLYTFLAQTNTLVPLKLDETLYTIWEKFERI